MPPHLHSPVAELRNFSNMDPMPDILTLSSRGTLTVPAKLRRQLRLGPDQVLVAEVTDQGLLLRPHQVVPLVGARQALAELPADAVGAARRIPRATLRKWIRKDEADLAALRKARGSRKR